MDPLFFLRANGAPASPTPGLGQQLQDAQATQDKLAALPAPQIAAPNFGSSVPALPAPIMPAAQENQVLTDQEKRNYLLNSGAGVDQIHNPLLRGIAKAGDIAANIAGSVFWPVRNAAMVIPGTTLHHNMLVAQATRNLENDQAIQQQNANTEQVQAKTADEQAQGEERKALEDKYGAQADSMKPVTITPAMAEAAGLPDLAGMALSQPTYEKLFGVNQNNQTKQAVAEGHDQTRVQTTQMNNDTSRANNTATNQTRETVSQAADKTRTLVAQMHDATSRANNENTNNHKGMTSKVAGGGSYKVPADVTKRAALAHNVTENADAVDSLLQQHPEIVGRTGGRYSNVQQMIGSNDPAIAELGVRMHNIALASNGAHGVRAQQAIGQTEDELFHHFLSGPNAIHSALNATRSSMQTFLDDEKNYQTSGQRTGNGKADEGGKPDFVYVPGKGLVKQ